MDNNTLTYLSYDGTMAGLLTAIFEVYERRLPTVKFLRPGNTAQDAFAQTLPITTNALKARRVWAGLGKRLSKEAQSQFYNCYLSELPDIEATLLAYARHAFDSPQNIEQDFGHPAVLTIAQTARKVWREKHRMEAFVRFQLLKDGLYYAVIEPDYNVLPLILPHFKSRYADQPWLIYDTRRRYGIHYSPETEQTSEVLLNWQEATGSAIPDETVLEATEEAYQQLWKDYFRHTGIPARKNMQLHLKHIPKRYWKYLTEKGLG